MGQQPIIRIATITAVIVAAAAVQAAGIRVAAVAVAVVTETVRHQTALGQEWVFPLLLNLLTLTFSL